MSSSPIECRRLSLEWEQPLADLFVALQEAGDYEHFHPHPLTPEEARSRVQYNGEDLYYILVEGDRILGYGMLRGWDEGYQIPSLGIAIHPLARGMGLGKAFMHFLHMAARRRGAEKIRLKVYPGNVVAVKLYKKLGYEFQAKDGEQLVGFVHL